MQTQFESPGVSNYFDPANPKAKSRGRSMVKMRVVNRNTRNLTVPHGNVIEPGTREFYCYDDEVAQVMKMVEPKRENIATARMRYKLAIAKEVAERLDPPFTGTLEELAAVIDAGPTDQIAEQLKYVLEVTPASMEGQFQDLTGRGLYPLDSAEVIQDGITEPQRETLQREQEKQAGVLAAALEKVLGKGPSATTEADIDALVKAKVAEELARQLGDKPATKK